MRVIEFNTPWGVYQLPVEVPVKHRTDYYKQDFGENSAEYRREWNFAYNDDFEAIDWLLNSMDWEDVKSTAVKVSDSIKVTDDNFWTSSDDFKIKDVKAIESATNHQ